MNENYVEAYAVVTAPWGDVTEIYAGSLTEWQWDNAQEWRKAARKRILADHTLDPNPRGWRVTWRTVLLVEA